LNFEGEVTAASSSAYGVALAVRGPRTASRCVIVPDADDSPATFEWGAATRGHALAPSGETAAAIDENGDVLLASRADGGWAVARLTRDDAQSVGFAGVDDRLLVGVAGAQVQTLALSKSPNGVEARVVLALGGHAGPVGSVAYCTGGNSGALVSTDSRGRVVVNPL
ncbi:MAG: hypothetical protein ACRCT8_08780, partial [Lacipirellulaceae bacterium]